MHAIERHLAIHIEYRHQELLKAARADRLAAIAQVGQANADATMPTRQRAAWSWPALRARLQATP